MITIIQRVTQAQVCIAGQQVGTIDSGIMALVAIERQDSEKSAQRLFERIINYRIFPDDPGRMNLNLQSIQGGLLLVPQFTLAADTNSGNRPSFTPAATPEKGEVLFNYFVSYAKQNYPLIETGEFGADMQVSLTNDGPVTFTLKV
ncbi:D-tyrosyl-tRNA(Tyr) deacylase [Bathymodiolus platifrons methanotrophic gill symbiont]|uniref:D-aminoacyl-tRNA deacylase n=1 Tax=Bathymodiolus platifrons methanotrophic gill symbiont TaxID=113268 RepID=UPI000B40C66B|nr:D-aminoacyl-tRNA deacylase [Bathymodiolus platifrons methanotrophic gill symbiont]TXL01475.1 D-tyrosyl-tRNA(Tyr) deacylase [Methylococcaceae bacterium HT1]TXL15043.1 D-tyrosyl-tRNA(Tyr) deacylase [Methylococcaceae bacterium HT4]TXL18637.1 D-tyrosyl-tRNA(Tyr) deacylase [Methylococcaceae bacterium HT3]TXL21352.1 D-tyrosyl-tRNA(Tyr) deacylase [Methylococcaceae bacterium HT5]TXL23527.1 D-tyrosyl-tRNA(Tyr) deacylase [Methylococcaceae bacterium HT2]